MATIYNLTGKYLDLVDQEEDLDPTLFHDTLDSIEGAIEDKADGYAMVDKEMAKDEQALKEESQRLRERATTIGNKRKLLKQTLQETMEVTGKEKIKTDKFTIYIQNNPASVKINDESLVPAYLTKTIHSVDKKAVSEKLKKGEDVPGTELVQGRSIRIR